MADEVHVGLGSLGFGLGLFGRDWSKLVALERWQRAFSESQREPDAVRADGNALRAPQEVKIRNILRGDPISQHLTDQGVDFASEAWACEDGLMPCPASARP